MTAKKIKILIGKPGLDGHDRGAKVIALALRDAGMEVIYSGLHQTVEQIVRTAVQEAVDVVGLSIMSGAHLPICQNLLKIMKKEGLGEIPVVVFFDKGSAAGAVFNPELDDGRLLTFEPTDELEVAVDVNRVAEPRGR